AKHWVNTLSPVGDHRQGRMSLQTELPSSKAKREQALRSILAARRRQILSQRPIESRNLNRTPRPLEPSPKDSPDVLEAQETRHGMYVTASSKAELPIADEPSSRIIVADLAGKDADVELVSKELEGEQVAERTTRKPSNESSPASSVEGKPASGNSRSNYSIGHRNSSSPPSSPTSSSLLASSQKPTDADARKKNIVSMPESLYNYFRPVESNIPVEDMSQFLYFGQKIQSEAHTSTGNTEATPTSPIASISRRRYSMKRFGATTPVPRLEEIMNEEMNIAVERRIVEKNKVSKIKNAFRGPENGVYYRKARPTDPTIASNVILGNSTETVCGTDSPDDNPSAHADRDQLRRERGSPPAHVPAESRNASNSTQIPQPVSAESEIEFRELDETDTEMFGDHTEQRIRRVDIFDVPQNRSRAPSARESNNIETSTSREKIARSSTEPFWTSPETSTLRIIVTEGSLDQGFAAGTDAVEKYTVKPVDSTEERVRSLASGEAPTPGAPTAATTRTKGRHREQKHRDQGQHRHREQQQQHVYAYTITNVTRLLRNYTGPGLSREEQGGSERGTGTTEITTGSVQRRQPPPPSLLLLPRAGSGIEADRAPAELSAGTTVEAVAAGGASTGHLVGERQRKVVTVAPQTGERAVNGASTQLTVNKSGPRPGKPTEVASRGAVRWNHTRARNDELEGVGDRRFLRKSASAVLNQRIGANGDEDAAVGKRRRTNGQIRRVKGIHDRTTNGSVSRNDEDTVNRTTELAMTTESVTAAEEVGSTTPQTVVNTTEEDASNLTEAVTSMDSDIGDTKDKNENESVRGSSSVTVTVDETVGPRETTATPIPAPVFPVTPRIIAETVREKETFTVSPTEPSQATDAKPTEPNKPYGMANLDPSEIQKMYRSNATVPTPATTIEAPTTAITTIETPTTRDQSATSDSKPDPDSPRRVSGERSPEVRGRNLSDKSKDKDDVLPIMQLYNTSDIFNGSGPMNSFSRGTERRVELPVESKQPDVSRTTEKVNDTVTPKSSPGDGPSTNRVPVSETTRKDKHDDARETSSHVPPTGPGRGPVNGNRTRHRPLYHHAILPEYNISVYPDELNRTFFDTGLISVSPRESVNVSEVISKRHDGDAIASQETVAVVSYILATLVVFPIAVGVGLILRRLILRNRKVLEESDTSSEISCRKDALNLENGDFKTSIEKAITKLPRIQHLCHEAEKPPPPSSQESRWEFPRDKLRLQTVLGQGNFGQVWKAEADDLTGHQGTTRLVAVKTVKEGASDREKEDLVRELEIMQQLGSHPNVVTLLGCCTEQEPHYLILEYVMYGKLLAYLRDHRTRQDFYNFSEDSAALTSRDLTVFGYCVARGMEYLASKKIIHRDLAARNVLVDHNKLCKIADFGMSRFANEDGEVIETRHGRNALPIRWMAPESLIYSLFTTKTDVWSFGILMWEIVTLGSTPYPDMTAREVMRNVQNGYRLERPSHCRSELFRVISRCWHADPDRRPEFQTLRRDLAQLLEDNMNGHYVDLESFASECTD
ncbi:uncharacterized protein LOC122395904, partial [Colletes gigas]|uniref:uncharacterized protein LOC122395904 n=1 Tax=Colletes gigas TaxID=935657 RepID=UPI001C9AFBCA